jgi:hypothetical protein
VKLLTRAALFLFGGLQVLIFLISAVKPAHAYVDPGSGLLVFQVGGSMLAGALFVMRTKIRKLLGLKTKSDRASALDERSSESEATPRSGTHG